MRMVTSLQVLAGDEGSSAPTDADRAVRAALEGYRGGIAQYADAAFLDIWYAQVTAEDLLSVVVAEEREDLRGELHQRATEADERRCGEEVHRGGRRSRPPGRGAAVPGSG